MLLCKVVLQKDDVLDTLGTLKEVLATFEKKWDDVPLNNETLSLDEVYSLFFAIVP